MFRQEEFEGLRKIKVEFCNVQLDIQFWNVGEEGNTKIRDVVWESQPNK